MPLLKIITRVAGNAALTVEFTNSTRLNPPTQVPRACTKHAASIGLLSMELNEAEPDITDRYVTISFADRWLK